jgi:hypothetical protein
MPWKLDMAAMDLCYKTVRAADCGRNKIIGESFKGQMNLYGADSPGSESRFDPWTLKTHRPLDSRLAILIQE